MILYLNPVKIFPSPASNSFVCKNQKVVFFYITRTFSEACWQIIKIIFLKDFFYELSILNRFDIKMTEQNQQNVY